MLQKEERRTQLMSAYKNQRDRIDALEAFINRFRYQATKAKQVQSRIKELDKIERIEVPEEEATIHFTIPQPPASGRTVIEVSHLSKDYPMPPVDGGPAGVNHVLQDVSFQIDRGDRIALVGANGAGKSTLIRLLSGLEPPTSGKVRLGHNVLADYFAQDQYKVLDPGAVMLDDISGIAPKVPVVELRSLLGCFMFSGDDVFKPLGVLSGGERNRYAMAKMLVSPANMLLLDEPTNHLDLRAKDVLLEAIANFTGTVLFVSHDRYFIDGLATRVFEVEDHRVHIFPGNYEDYLWRKSGGPEKVAVSLTDSLSPSPLPSNLPLSRVPHISILRCGIRATMRQIRNRPPSASIPSNSSRSKTASQPSSRNSSPSTPASKPPSRVSATTSPRKSRREQPPRWTNCASNALPYSPSGIPSLRHSKNRAAHPPPESANGCD